MRADTGTDQRRRVRHHPDHRRPGQQLGFQRGRGDTRRDGDEHLLGAVTRRPGRPPGDLPDHRLDVGGFDGDDDERRVFHRLAHRSSPGPRSLGQVRARSGIRSATTRSLTCRPARSRPDSRASPMLPPPTIAILAMPKAWQTHGFRGTSAALPRGGHHRQLAGLHHDAAQRCRRPCGPRRTSPARSACRCTTTRSQPSAGRPRR